MLKTIKNDVNTLILPLKTKRLFTIRRQESVINFLYDKDVRSFVVMVVVLFENFINFLVDCG